MELVWLIYIVNLDHSKQHGYHGNLKVKETFLILLTVYAMNVIWISCILKGKRNAYFELRNFGFILRTLFFLISAIYTH